MYFYSYIKESNSVSHLPLNIMDLLVNIDKVVFLNRFLRHGNLGKMSPWEQMTIIQDVLTHL